jgi:uncharacterized protein YndB with AHSA1/START domain
MNTDDYTRTITIAAPIDTTFATVSTVEGVRAWWSSTASGSAEVGEELVFGFADTTIMRVDESTAPHRVQWTCLKCGVTDWVGTTITFELSEVDGDRTSLHFTHHGLRPDVECWDMCETGWNHYLGSITRLAQTGVGQPDRNTSR